MAQPTTVRVSYKDKDWDIPAEISALNARQPGAAAMYIDGLIADEEARAAQIEQRQQVELEAEFTAVKTRLSDLESSEKVVQFLTKENAALSKAVEAQSKQIEALESSGAAAGSASAEARSVAYDLSNASTAAIGTLATLQSENDRLQNTITSMTEQLEALQAQFDAQAEQALALSKSRMEMSQELVNKLIDDVATVEARAVQAESQAAGALQTAENARRINDGSLTREQLNAIVDGQIQASAEAITELVISQIRDQFPTGLGGIRFDGDYMAETNKDRTNSVELRRGTDMDVKKAIRRGQKRK